MRTFLPLLALALLAPLVPSVPADSDGVTIPYARQGDSITRVESLPVVEEDEVRVVDAMAFYNWTATPSGVEDAFGVERLAYPVDRVLCHEDWCARETRWLDVATRQAALVEIAEGGRAWASLGAFIVSSSSPLPVNEGDVHVERRVRGPHVSPEHALAGVHLAPGMRIPVEIPPNALDLDGAELHLEAVGWESVDGQRLFRVDLVPPAGHSAEIAFWYDGTLPIPSLVRWTVRLSPDAGGGVMEGESRVLHAIAGAGPLLMDQEYAAPPFAASRDAPRAAYTRDGIAERFLDAVPLSEAVARARATPEFLLFEMDHADVYLAHAIVEDNPSKGVTWWGLGYAAGGETDGLLFLVEWRRVADALPPVVTVTAHRGPQETAFPPFARYEGRAFGCADAAWSDLRAEGEPLAGQRRIAVFSIVPDTPDVEVYCTVGATTRATATALRADGYGHEVGFAWADVAGATAGLLETGRGEAAWRMSLNAWTRALTE